MKRTPRRRHRPQRQTEKEQNSFFSATPNPTVQAKENDRFLPSQLNISPANDPAEKEADQVADRVVRGVQDGKNAAIQRKDMVNRMAEQEEEPAAKIQRQAEEEEPAAKLQRRTEEEEPQAKLDIQRQAEEEEPQAKTQQTNPSAVEQNEQQRPSTDTLESLIERTKGQGFALPEDIRQAMEAQFEADFSRVRIHTDSEAVRMCQMINAQAFTHGYDIYFNTAKYHPHTETGQNLLAHELTHVVQQKGR